MSAKLVISKAGFNALTETNPNNLIFSSDYNTLKYYASGTLSLAVSGSSVETSVTHNLGYVPYFTVYHNTPTDPAKFSMTPFAFEGFGFYTYIDAYADTTKIYFAIQTNAATATIDFYYKIYKNDLGI